MTIRHWQDTEELPEASTWLLEASAGTGKTYQIASLVLRLVGEHGLAIDRILAITFTEAATAELRDRVRTRLRDALALVRAGTPPGGDVVLERVLGSVGSEQLQARLELALGRFDLAPISTIHGFCNRVLQDLAFDTGQDPELELLPDAGEVIEQIVDDTLATLYAAASVDELALLDGGGLNRGSLSFVARVMAGASEPTVVPPGAADLGEVLARLREWRARSRAMRERWDREDAAGPLAELLDDTGDVGKRKRRLKGAQRRHYEKRIERVAEWLAGGAGSSDGDLAKVLSQLRCESVTQAWQGSQAELAARRWPALLAELERFGAEHVAFWQSFAPLGPFARSARQRVEAELRRRRALTFDGMLSRLAARIEHDGGAGGNLAARIRARFDAVLVDEFQDTDAAQWSVIEAAFHGRRRLLLIGDPKQAIYGFRGADVHVYLRASGCVADGHRRTMHRNWRSDPRAVEAMSALWRAGSGVFEQDGIDLVAVQAQQPDRIEPLAAGLEIRWIDERLLAGATGGRIGSKASAPVPELVAREVVALLSGERGALCEGPGQVRAIAPADLAVLVGTHFEAASVRRALGRAGVASVAQSRDSVFDTPVAGWLAAWLEAVAAAGRDREARTAVVTPLFGWTANELAWALEVSNRGEAAERDRAATGTEKRDWNEWTARLRACAQGWARRGFAATLDRESTHFGVLPRVLALPDGERHATDLRHLFELLHVEQRTRRQGAGGLAEWLRAQRGTSSEAALQRLESDARAVRIETVHASKGLEYPIVLLPFAWSAHAKTRDNGEPLLVRDDRGAELYLGVLGAPGRGERRERLAAEQRREELRKLYVSLTRAKHRTIAWYGPIGRDGAKTSASALGRLLMRSAEAPGFDDEAMPDFAADPAGAWKEASARLDALVSRSSGAVSWRAEPPLAGSPAWTPPDRSSVALRLASWPPDRGDLLGPWMVASYSSLAPGSAAPDRDERARADTPLEPDEPERSGERSVVGIAPPALAAFPARPRLAHGGGKRYGTCVHEVLEQLDFTTARAKDGRSLPELIGTAARRAGLDRHEQLTAELAEHLPALLATPLDSTRDDDVVRGLPPGFGLAALSVADRLDELHFDLRLGGGVAWRRDPAAPAAGRVDPQAVYDAVLAAADPAPGHLEPWLDWLRARRAAGRDLIPPLAGILTGTIDLVLRTSSAGAARYFIVDYKTNRIGLSEPGHYAGAWLGWEMAHAAYYLQALVYTLALHRHLGQRLPGYRYDEHVGGYLYLFLRGMSGARTPRDPETGRCLGVLGGFWPEAVVTALDAALGRTEEGAA